MNQNMFPDPPGEVGIADKPKVEGQYTPVNIGPGAGLADVLSEGLAVVADSDGAGDSGE